MKNLLRVVAVGIFCITSLFTAPLVVSAQTTLGDFGAVSANLKINGSDTPPAVAKGSRIVLSWTSDGADYCRSNWTKSLLKPSGKQAGKITASRSFSVTCFNENGDSDNDSVRIAVGSPTQSSASASAPIQPAGSPNSPAEVLSAPSSARGNVGTPIPPENPNFPSPVRVNEDAPAPVCEVTVNGSTGPVFITPGDSIKIKWTTNAAIHTTNWPSPVHSPVPEYSPDTHASTRESIFSPSVNTTYVLSCMDERNRQIGLAKVLVVVGSLPQGKTADDVIIPDFSVDLRVNGKKNVTVEEGSSAELTWSSVGDIDLCALSHETSFRGRSGLGLKVGPLLKTTTYKISCFSPNAAKGQNGGSRAVANDSVTVTVVPRGTKIILPAGNTGVGNKGVVPGNVGTPSLEVSCHYIGATLDSDRNTLLVGLEAQWLMEASGGTGEYEISWSGTDGLSGTGAIVSKVYATKGTKMASVTVISGRESKSISCDPLSIIDNVKGLPNTPSEVLVAPARATNAQSSSDSSVTSAPSPAPTQNGTTVNLWARTKVTESDNAVSILPGEPVALVWTTTGPVYYCSSDWSSYLTGSGSYTALPATSRTYTVTCSDYSGSGKASGSVRVEVVPQVASPQTSSYGNTGAGNTGSGNTGTFVVPAVIVNTTTSGNTGTAGNVGSGNTGISSAPSYTISTPSVSGSSNGTGQLYEGPMVIITSVSNIGGGVSGTVTPSFQFSSNDSNWYDWATGSAVSGISSGGSKLSRYPWDGGAGTFYFRATLGDKVSGSTRVEIVTKPMVTVSPVTASGNTGSGNVGSGNVGSGNTGTSATSATPVVIVNTATSGNTGSGNVGSGNVGSGNVGSGNVAAPLVPANLSAGTAVVIGTSAGGGSIYAGDMTIRTTVSNSGGAQTTSVPALWEFSTNGVNWYPWVSASDISGLPTGGTKVVDYSWVGGTGSYCFHLKLGESNTSGSACVNIIAKVSQATIFSQFGSIAGAVQSIWQDVFAR